MHLDFCHIVLSKALIFLSGYANTYVRVTMVTDIIKMCLALLSRCVSTYVGFLRFCFSCVGLLFTRPLELLLLPAQLADDIRRRASSLALSAIKINLMLFCLLCSLIIMFLIAPSTHRFAQVIEQQ